MSDASQSLTDQVISAFGSVTELANSLGHPNVTTVHGWKRKQKIPHWRDHEIIEAAKRLNKKLPEEFLARQQSATGQIGEDDC